MLLSDDGIGKLFDNFQRSAFRMETQPVYTMEAEQDELRQFLAGEPIPQGFNAGWHNEVRGNLAAGKTMTRLKVVRRPFTDYTRFLFGWAIPGNVEAGEDYRILDLTDSELAIPNQDFWLFDDETVALLNFNEDGTLQSRELAQEVAPYLEWRDIALRESVPFGDYRP
ncbi:hypothetical protein EV191_108220 [Tamaricihabitans halophyticus]|uniref:DUF6879 domain-containing protein n=1 Tax=Tamaricihabitans halophyticus TaxID=1262583 RepID=A0A4R2QST9_9PSEU|nr:DUF6879 family protein [Tamaricihabitans halophyticus]TCP50131.1 hypothetical protein EV191_108220 [Tamaricihabitans halophyticus]